MRIMISLAVAALLNSAVLAYGDWAAYKDGFQNNTGINYTTVGTNCTACIRGGFDACLLSTGYQPGNVTALQCNNYPTTPEINPPVVGSVPNGWFCSWGSFDQTNAIVAGCRPKFYQTQNTSGSFVCGDYEIDLVNGGAYQSRLVSNLPLYQSCTYRVKSSCGYPAVALTQGNDWMKEDFDVAYAARDMNFDDDFDQTYWHNYTTSWSGSFLTKDKLPTGVITEGEGQAKLPETVIQECNDKPRNLWLTITRVKVTPKPTNKTSEFLSERQLAGVLYDFEAGFYSSIGGNAKVLGAISFALFAVLSVFAF